MSTQNTPGPRMTDKEAARELFVAGYQQALDDVAMELSLRAGCDMDFLRRLRARASAVVASAAIAKAAGGAS